MTTKLAKAAFQNKTTGARLEGEFIADTGPTWMIKPAGHPVAVLAKSEWDSVAPTRGAFDNDFLNNIFGGRA